MRTYCLVGSVLMILIYQGALADNDTTTDMVKATDSRIELISSIGKVLRNLVSKYWEGNQNEETFMGRCFGIAKKIRAIMPIAIFLMGVIMTLLGFLTLFSLKTLGMVGLLLLINTSGIVAKVVAAFAQKKGHDSNHPQNVHFHVHQNKDGEYHVGHSSPGSGWNGWDDRVGRINSDLDLDKIESYNLYNKLLNNPNLRYFQHANR